jgi:hypothetical protein
MLLHEVIQAVKILGKLSTFLHVQCGLKLCDDCLRALNVIVNLLVLACKIFLVETQLSSCHEA